MSKYLSSSSSSAAQDAHSDEVRGQNKVSALARDLASKFAGEKKKPDDGVGSSRHGQPNPKPLVMPNRNLLADLCYFCKEKVYIVERYTLRGILFHRNCLRCDYCNAILRVTSYACQTLDDGERKFLV